MNRPIEVEVVDLGMGVIAEKLTIAFNEIIKNLKDPNTSVRPSREINLKLKFMANDDRETVNYEITTSTKLAPAVSQVGMAFVGLKNGRAVCFESNPDQANMFDEPDAASVIDGVDQETGEVVG